MKKQLVKNRKPPKTTVNGHLHKFSSAEIKIEVPRGFMYDHPWFMPWWQTLIMDRAPDDWTCVDAPVHARIIFPYEIVIECGHVSGLVDAAFHLPRAGMAMRGAGPNHYHGL